MYNNIQDFDRQVTYLGVQQWSGRTTHLLKVSFPDYGSKAYRIQGDENLCEVEQKIFVPAAKMLELNPEVDDYWDVSPGQVIQVPTSYGKESIFMVDTENFLPVVQIVYDEKGLFERYEYHDLKVNPRFSTTEFTPDFPGYRF
jgi:hypothetical protein